MFVIENKFSVRTNIFLLKFIGIFNGYPTFVISIAFVGLCTAVIGDVAGHLGCFINLKDCVNAIAFVALGTSVPGTRVIPLLGFCFIFVYIVDAFISSYFSCLSSSVRLTFYSNYPTLQPLLMVIQPLSSLSWQLGCALQSLVTSPVTWDASLTSKIVWMPSPSWLLAPLSRVSTNGNSSAR